MTRMFYTTGQNYVSIASSDLPAISDLSGKLNISQIKPAGVTGQSIYEIGSDTLAWRYPNHIAGTAGYYIMPYPLETTIVDVYPTVNDQVELLSVYISNTLSIASVSFRIDASRPGAHASVGLYDLAGNLLFTTGAKSAASTGVKTETLSGIGIILPGSYYWAWTADNTLIALMGFDPGSADYMDLLNAGQAQRLIASESSSVGVLPSTIDVNSLTSSTDPIVLGKLQGG